MKKVSALLTAVIMMLAVFAPCASAVVASVDGTLSFTPGNTRWSIPVDNYAWLDNLFIRDDVNSVVPKEVVPKPDDYPYSHTIEHFIDECENYEALYELDEEEITQTYYQIIDVMYYGVIALSMTSDIDTMRDYLTEYGIVLPEEESADDVAAVSVVYAALKNNATYILYGKEIVIPRGTTLEGALVIILAGVTGNYIPSGVNTVLGFALQAVKNYVAEFEQLPMSKNPDAEEIFYWSKVITVVENGYQVPTSNYADLTEVEKAYVDSAYHATVIELGFDVRIDPIKLLSVTSKDEDLGIERLILETMLTESGVEFTQQQPVNQLFEMACENGWFVLENEFYSDVFNYEIYVKETSEKIWFTPITVGQQLTNGDAANIKVVLDGQEVGYSSTTAVALNPELEKETIVLGVFYNDGVNINDSAVYTFTIIKEEVDESTTVDSTDIIGQIGEFVGSIVPDNEIVTSIFQEITGVTAQVTTSASSAEEFLTTYPTTEAESTTSYFQDFEYFKQLLGDTYTTDAQGNIVTTSVYETTTVQQTEKTVIQYAVETVTENIELVVAPTGLLALGGLVGFLMTKKHKDSEFTEYTEEETEE